MFNFSLPKPDIFSPFGIAVIDIGTVNGHASPPSTLQGIFLSDHGSNRVILALDNGSNPNFDPLQNYILLDLAFSGLSSDTPKSDCIR